MNPTDGLLFLQHVVEYADDHLFPGSRCTHCGASTVDFTISATVRTPPWPAEPEIASYDLECFACHHRVSVPATVLEGYSTRASMPKVEVTCPTCQQIVLEYTLVEHPSTGEKYCGACAKVEDMLGPIIAVQEGTLL